MKTNLVLKLLLVALLPAPLIAAVEFPFLNQSFEVTTELRVRKITDDLSEELRLGLGVLDEKVDLGKVTLTAGSSTSSFNTNETSMTKQYHPAGVIKDGKYHDLIAYKGHRFTPVLVIKETRSAKSTGRLYEFGLFSEDVQQGAIDLEVDGEATSLKLAKVTGAPAVIDGELVVPTYSIRPVKK